MADSTPPLSGFEGADLLDAAREAMAGFRDRLAAERAVEQGLIPPGRIEEILQAAESAGSLEEALVRGGWATPEQVARLSGPPAPPVPPEVLEARGIPDRTLGPFVLVSVIGRGGWPWSGGPGMGASIDGSR